VTVKKRPIVRIADIDLNEDDVDMRNDADDISVEGSTEDEEMEEDGDPEEFIDVLDILDGKGEVDNGSDEEVVSKKADQRTREIEEPAGDSSDEEDDEEDAEVEDDEEIALSASDAEEVEPEALAELGNFISQLDPGKKRKAPTDEDTTSQAEAQRVRKRRVIKERTEGGVENEFSARPSGIHFPDILLLTVN
jgi:U3 small nucleolar RNA-associated protein 14